jgi:limonene-1,2-epoxide hydrolase
MALDPPLNPADLHEIQKANVKVVNDFLASWYEPHKTDISFLVPDGRYKTNDNTPALKADELIPYLKSAMGPEDRVVVITYETFAKGPLVVNSRTDIVKSPGKKDRAFDIVSHFLLKNGKIVEWTDHVYAWKEAWS